MFNTVYKTNIFGKDINLFHSPNLSSFLLKNIIGTVAVKMPSLYYYIKEKIKISFLFTNKFFYKSFIKHIFTNYNTLIRFYFIKLKIRGLGYHIRRISENFYYFFFNYTNFYYFYAPLCIKVIVKKKRMILISQN